MGYLSQESFTVERLLNVPFFLGMKIKKAQRRGKLNDLVSEAL